MAECQILITPEDFFRKVVRTDGSGNYALAINEVVGYTTPEQCQDGITWQDILMMVYNNDLEAINVMNVT